VAGRRPGVPAPGAHRDQRGVWSIGGADFGPSVEAPALIGAGAWVSADASVVNSIIGAGCRVEAGARVVESVLMPGVEVGKGAVVDRSILGRAAGVGEAAHVTGLSVIGDGYLVEPGTELDGARLPAPEAL
jgi:ADP-glucose pyrophosphorylase